MSDAMSVVGLEVPALRVPGAVARVDGGLAAQTDDQLVFEWLDACARSDRTRTAYAAEAARWRAFLVWRSKERFPGADPRRLILLARSEDAKAYVWWIGQGDRYAPGPDARREDLPLELAVAAGLRHPRRDDVATARHRARLADIPTPPTRQSSTRPRDPTDAEFRVEPPGLSFATVDKVRAILASLYTHLQDRRDQDALPDLVPHPFRTLKPGRGRGEGLTKGASTAQAQTLKPVDYLDKSLGQEGLQVLREAANRNDDTRTPLESARDRWIVALLIGLTPRLSELARLGWSDLKFDGVDMNFNLIRKGNRSDPSPPPDWLVDEMLVWRRWCGLSDYPDLAIEAGDSVLRASPSGRGARNKKDHTGHAVKAHALSPVTVSRWITSIFISAAGIAKQRATTAADPRQRMIYQRLAMQLITPGAGSHRLRHTIGSLLPVSEAQGALGHASVATTTKFYGDGRRQQVKKAREKYLAPRGRK